MPNRLVTGTIPAFRLSVINKDERINLLYYVTFPPLQSFPSWELSDSLL
jgi:hypothetical protein